MSEKIKLQNLDRLQKIVSPEGTPTQFFIRFIQDRGGNVTDLQAIIDILEEIVNSFKDNEIIAGEALEGGGKLADGDVTIDHEESPVTPGVYGDGSNIPQIVIDEFGHVTGAMEVPVAVVGGIELEEAGTPIAGGPFTTLNFNSGATVVDAGGAVADIDIAGGGGGGGGGGGLIGEVVATGSTNSMTIAIPSGYKSLRIEVNAQGATANDAIVQFNGDTGANYGWTRFYSNNTTGSVGTGGQNVGNNDTGITTTVALNVGGNAAGTLVLDIPAPGSPFYKNVFWESLQPANTSGTEMYQIIGKAMWRNTAAINSITVTASSGNFAAGSTLRAIGVNGSGGSGSIVLLSTTILAVDAGAFSIAVPAGYRDLILRGSVRATSGNSREDFCTRMNSDAGGASYFRNYGNINAGAYGAFQDANRSDFPFVWAPSGAAPANQWGTFEARISDYLMTDRYKNIRCHAETSISTTDNITIDVSGAWRNTAAINNLDFYFSGGNVKAGSRVSLYGVVE